MRGGYRIPALARAAIVRAAGFTLVWLALTEGDLASFWLAALSIAGATLASLLLMPPVRGPLRLLALPPFAWFFLRQSVLGGIDVAFRAMRPRKVVAPTFMHYETRLANPGQIVLYSNIASLLPGTVVAEIHDGRLLVHVLDEGIPAVRTLEDLEKKVAALSEDGPAGRTEG